MTDSILKQNVIDELDFEPSIDAADIGVAVDNGVVTLTGHVPTYAQKIKVEDVVRSVKGVMAIAQEMEVRPFGTHRTADDEIAKRAVNTIAWNTSIPSGAVQIRVEDGWIRLTGKAEWQYQKNAAEDAVRHLAGVIGVTNQIEIKPRPSTYDIKQRIESALKRNAELEAQAIKVNVLGNGAVRLEGRVHAWSERRAAERAAWSAAGVKTVEDKITIG